MPYTNVALSHNVAYAIYYMEGRAHNGHNKRNVCISCINMMSEKNFLYQMTVVIGRKSGMDTDKRKQIQALLIIQSFAVDELDPNITDNYYIANQFGRKFAETYYPNRQAIVYTQIDGRSGLIHNHIVVCNVSLADGSAIPSEKYRVLIVRKACDDLMLQEKIKLSEALPTGNDHDIVYGTANEKFTRHEKRLLQDNEEIKKWNEAHKNDEHFQAKPLKYIYEQDIKQRVREAIAASTSEDDFINVQLPAHGISLGRIGNSKSAAEGVYWTYVLIDRSNVPPDDPDTIKNKKISARSYTCGRNYEPVHLREILQQEQKQTYSLSKLKPDLNMQSTNSSADNSPPELSDNVTEPKPENHISDTYSKRRKKKNGKKEFAENYSLVDNSKMIAEKLIRDTKKALRDEIERSARQQAREALIGFENDDNNDFSGQDDVWPEDINRKKSNK